MREKTSLLEFGVDSADCSVQSAGSLLGGGLAKLAMSGGSRTRAICKEKQQRQTADSCSVRRCPQHDRTGKGQARRYEHSSGQRSFSVRLCARRCYAQYKIEKGKTLSQVNRLQR